MKWQSMDTAPKDGTPCLVLAKRPIGYSVVKVPEGVPDMWARAVVAFHHGMSSDGHDLGWSLAGPFGYTIGTDISLLGWIAIPDFSGHSDGHNDDK